MKRLIFLSVIFFFGCATIRPTLNFEQKRAQRYQQFTQEAKTKPWMEAVTNYKENIKADYRDIMGPSAAFDEKVDLSYNNVLFKFILSNPGTYEKMMELWEDSSGPKPTREQIQAWIDSTEKRIAQLDDVIAMEVEAAEQRAKDDAERGRKIAQFVVGTLMLSAAVLGAAAAGAAAAQPTYAPTPSYAPVVPIAPETYGNYTIMRNGNFTTVYTPSHIYTCTTIGNITNCN